MILYLLENGPTIGVKWLGAVCMSPRDPDPTAIPLFNHWPSDSLGAYVRITAEIEVMESMCFYFHTRNMAILRVDEELVLSQETCCTQIKRINIQQRVCVFHYACPLLLPVTNVLYYSNYCAQGDRPTISWCKCSINSFCPMREIDSQPRQHKAF